MHSDVRAEPATDTELREWSAGAEYHRTSQEAPSFTETAASLSRGRLGSISQAQTAWRRVLYTAEKKILTVNTETNRTYCLIQKAILGANMTFFFFLIWCAIENWVLNDFYPQIQHYHGNAEQF